MNAERWEEAKEKTMELGIIVARRLSLDNVANLRRDHQSVL